jgi:Sulfotransferase family
VIKEPNGSYGAEFLMQLLPRARMIFLARDGRDVLDSQLALRTRFGAVRRGMQVVDTASERLAFVRTQGRLWVNNMTAVDRAFAAHDPELRVRLRYEDLRADTFDTLLPVARWLGDERDSDELRRAVEENAFESTPRLKRGKGRMRRAASPGLWRENLSAEEQRVANEIMGETLSRLGYEV